MNNKLSKVFLLILLIGAFTILYAFTGFFISKKHVAHAQYAQSMESDSGYRIIDPTINPSSNDDQSSSGGYNLFSTIGGTLQDERFKSDNYQLGAGQTYTFTANVPKISSVQVSDESMCGEGGCYDRARFTIDSQSNPSDTLYLIEISPDNWSTIYCLDGNTHSPKGLAEKTSDDYLSKSQWETGVWSQANVMDLNSDTQYQIRSRALNGDFTESAPGPSVTFTTNSPKIIFDLDIADTTGGNLQNCFAGHSDNGDGTCSATYNPTQDGTIDDSWIRDSSSNSLTWFDNTSKQIAYIEWDISDLADAREIENVTLKYHGNTDDTTSADIVHLIQNQPSATANDSSGNQAIFNEITNSDVYVSSWDPSTGTNQSIDLSSQASNTLYNQIINQDYWFAIGFNPTGGNADSIYSQEYTSANPVPQLEVIYSKSYINTTWPYNLELGEINALGPTTAPEYVWVYLGTNAVNGASISVRDANNGLHSTQTGQTIPSVSADLSTADNGFGLKVDTSNLYSNSGNPGYIMPTSKYDTTGADEVGDVSTSISNILCTISDDTDDCATGISRPITQGRAAIWIKAKTSLDIPTGTYTDTITFTTIGTF